MAAEELMQMAAEAVHEIMGDAVGFAVVMWVPGKEHLDGAVAYVTPPDRCSTAPKALETAAALMRLHTTAGAA